MMQLRVLTLALASFALLGPVIRAQEMAATKATDAQILSKIHKTNQSEILLGRMVESHSTNDSVLGYARRIVDDHKKADQQTMDLANRTKIKIETIPMSPQEAELQARLSSQMGANFDREYLKAMEEGHAKAIEWLGTAQASAQKPEVAEFIGELLPTLHHHHDIAVMVEKQNKKTSTG